MSSQQPPIRNIDILDVVAELKSGGVDLVISCDGALDESDETVDLLLAKIHSYMAAALHESFAETYPAAQRGPTRIFVSCAFDVSDRAREALLDAAELAEERGFEVRLVSSMDTIQ